MRVLFILNAFGEISGAEHVLFDFLKTAPEIEPLILQIGPRENDLSEYSSVVPSENCFYIHTAMPFMSGFSRQWFMGLLRSLLCKKIKRHEIIKKLLNDSSIRLMYFNNSFEAAAFFPIFSNKKTMVHIHDMVDMFRPAHKKYVLIACKEAGYVLTASEACRTMLIKNGINQQKISTAYNGISFPEVQYDKSISDTVVIGFVGSAIKRKGFDTYISILNGLKQTAEFAGKKLKSIIITNSGNEEPFFNYCLSKLDSKIETRVFCRISREKVIDEYRKMTLLLVPSRFDPLPTVVLEASMAGVPVIGSNKDGIPEMQTDSDMLFEVNDMNEAITKIKKWVLLPEEVKKQKMKIIQKHIKSTFTAENKKKTVLEGIKRAINQ